MTITKKFEPEAIQKKIPKKYFILTIFGLLILALVQIWTNNTVITFSEKYEKLSILEKSLSLDNQILENEIAKHSSLSRIASKSAELGFYHNPSIQYIR